MMARRPTFWIPPLWTPACFNGAAPVKARRLTSDADKARLKLGLQWGRANEGAETRRNRHELQRRRDTSMEPRRRWRGNLAVVGLGIWAVPLQWGRANEGAETNHAARSALL